MLFERLGLDFDIVVPDADESEIEVTRKPAGVVKKLAILKLDHVKRKLDGGSGLIVTADTVVHAGRILGKPENREDAREMLQTLSGNWHTVYTGVAMAREGHREVFHEASKVKFMDLTDSEIDAYLDSGEYRDKAGAYAIQGRGAFFIERIKGDYYNVVGFPVNRFIKILRDRFGLDVFLNG